MKYEIKKFDAGGRVGSITHNGKSLITPNILPVVSPFENLIQPKELFEEFGVSALFTNAYLLYNKKEKARMAEKSGIHAYLDYPGLIATDSGAFQHYMYGNSKDITPLEIEQFQESIKSDFPVILDIPVQLTDSQERAKDKVIQTIARAKENVERRQTSHCAWYGPIHGSRYPDILKVSCEEMNALDFGVYAVGGIVKAMNEYAFELCTDIFLTVKKYIRKDKPLHMFGLGLPQFFSLAVATGADLMDSAAYILFAKEGRYFTLEGTKNVFELSELPCTCPICTSYSIKDIQSLYKSESKQKKRSATNKGIELIARHNLYVTMGELRTIREAIRSGNLWELVEQRIHSHPKLIKAYKKVSQYSEIIEEQVPIEKRKGQFLNGQLSLSRPVFRRMSRKIQQTYKLNKKSVVILIPESQQTLFNSNEGRDWIHSSELLISTSTTPIKIFVLSSYFGIIPLDLYNIYPFSQREWVEPFSSQILKEVSMFTELNQKLISQIIFIHPTESDKIPQFEQVVKKLEKKEFNVLTIKKIEDMGLILQDLV